MGKKTMTVDGNTAAAYVAYAFTDVAAIYPITPSSTMAEVVDDWSAKGRKNIFGQPVKVVEMQSEAGAAGALHGSLQAGALTTTFTSSQGLLLMIPNMYKMAGELLPAVFHVSARSIAAQALSIFGDHQDVMATRQTGCVILASGSVQEVMDLSPVAHLSAIKGRLPFVSFFDGFRTSHEIQKIEALEYEELEKLIDYDALQKFRDNALSPNHPVTRGTSQNADIYFQTREASNPFYDEIIPIVEKHMDDISKLTGRKYGLFNYYGAQDAEHIIVAIGSVCETIEETIDYLNANGEKYGVVKVHLYRPFSLKHFIDVVPKTVKRISVLDRTKEPGAIGEPLYLDVRNCYFDQKNPPMIIGGRYGLSSKDVTPTDIKAVFDNLKSEEPKNHFTVGIEDDVTGTSIPVENKLIVSNPGTVRCKFWGLGADGTVGANKQAIKIIGEYTDKYVQAYFAYDSKKSRGLTTSHLRFGDVPIKSTYLIDEADYIACHNPSYVNNYDLTKGLIDGGIFVLNCPWNEEELEEYLPNKLKKELADKNIQFYCIDAVTIANELGLDNRINMITQAAFFKLSNIIPMEEAMKYLKEEIVKAYGRMGDDVVAMNNKALEKGFTSLHKIEIPEAWKNLEEQIKEYDGPEFVRKIMKPMIAGNGDELPVSAFKGREDGTFPCGTTAYEKRGIAVNVPEWQVEHCIQCNQCAYVCPHACIRPFLLNNEEEVNAPNTLKTKKANGKGLEGLQFKIQVSTLDCTGCGNCADVCPAPSKALIMKGLETQTKEEVPNWEYLRNKVSYKGNLVEGLNVKDSQFKTPLMEFSGACSGCGETPYIRLATQLFGERMMIANATGCSSIWAGSAPATAYTCNHEGKGPAWANSLFEDNAEFGYGMYLGVNQIRDGIQRNMKTLIEHDLDSALTEVLEKWIETKENGKNSRQASEKVLEIIDKISPQSEEDIKAIKNIKDYSDYLVKRSQWMVGGDGWAYDIGFGGLDHVLASGEDINILVFDTEIYSNTGGQASKATPTAAIAKFAASGKKTGKKDLGRMMKTYGNVYVAQIAIGADKNQTIKAFLEAENYPGPSIIIAYAPCISHGIKEGMGRSMANMSQAVEAGYWHLFRYNPMLKKEGKNPFILDSKEPKTSFRDFLMGQVRYTSLLKEFPEQAEDLFAQAEENAKEKWNLYKALSLGTAVE